MAQGILQEQPTKDGKGMGGEGTQKLQTHTYRWYPLPDPYLLESSHFVNGIFGQKRLAISETEGCWTERKTHA